MFLNAISFATSFSESVFCHRWKWCGRKWQILAIAVLSNVRTLNWCMLNIFHKIIFYFQFSIFLFSISGICIALARQLGKKNTGSAMHDLSVILSMIPHLSSALKSLKLFELITIWNFRWLQPLQSRSSDAVNWHFNNFGAV